jgi:YVTN family beta-propeller protein
LNAVLSPNGRFLLITDDGRRTQFLQVISVASGAIIQTIPYPWPSGLFVGLSYSADGSEVFASGGGQEVIHDFSVAPDGTLTAEPDIPLTTAPGQNPFPAGLATIETHPLVAVAEETWNRLAFVNTITHQVMVRTPVGLNPYDVVYKPGTNQIYVSNWGSATVSVVNANSHHVTNTIPVRNHPSAMIIGHNGLLLYVADSNSDEVSVISTTTDQVVGTISVSPFPGAPPGSSPEGLSLSPNGRTLYVANSGENAVVVVGLGKSGTSGKILGRVPTAEYPTSVTVASGGKKLFITNGDGYGPAPNVGDGQHYFNTLEGTLSIVPAPNSAALSTYSGQVTQDNQMQQAVSGGAPPKTAWPFGDGVSPIKHIIYVIKENQTYDQVLGDIPGADGDPALDKYPASVTPNLHALSMDFGTFDNFYADGQTSADGHDWVMSANANDFNMKMWPETYGNRGQGGHYQGQTATDLSPGGYLWDRAAQAGVTYRDYGEFLAYATPGYTPIPELQSPTCTGPVATIYVYKLIDPGSVLCFPPSVPVPNAPALAGHTDPRYPGEDYQYSDINRMFEWEREFRQYVVNNDLPQLEIMWLPNDHTKSNATLYPTPSSFLALNDQAIGMLVDAVSHSPYWSSTAIFITQDDAQGAWDHINAQRTEALVVSPYTRTTQPVVNSDLFDDNSMLRTIESILGLGPMSQFDMTATPMWSAFHATPDMRPYDLKPMQIPMAFNPALPPSTVTPTVTGTPATPVGTATATSTVLPTPTALPTSTAPPATETATGVPPPTSTQVPTATSTAAPTATSTAAPTPTATP